ncbi:MAG TPA: SCO family protein [Vicinamibacterales bacterium]|nr:SCO family protein [Vicinamibacterales bacterium]
MTLPNRYALAIAALVVTGAVSVAAQGDAPGLRPASGPTSSAVPPALQQVRFDQKLDATLPLDATFRDEQGNTVTLGSYFGRRPVVLAFVYYECPMLCTQILNGLASGIGVLDQTVGTDFDVVTISFDARETPVMAAAKKATYLDRYGRPGAESGWHFLTGDETNIKRVTDTAGFQFAWDEQTQQFAHASGVIVVTPDGRLARYLFGIEYSPRDLKFALMESSAGRIGSVVDQVLLYCYHYEPATGSYSLAAMNAVRLGGAVTMAILFGFIAISLRRDGRAPAGH